MLEKVLQSILRRYFGEFITGLEKVELAFWTGKIHIQDASLKHDKINELLRAHHIPLSLSFSFIGGLDIDIPWNRLSSAPV
jgi:vacuolar protein sorting-associated protein 13A/C